MAELGLIVNKYAVSATIRASSVAWKYRVEVEGGEHYDLDIQDGAEIPLLLEIFRSDNTVYFDPATRTLSTGWNDPGE